MWAASHMEPRPAAAQATEAEAAQVLLEAALDFESRGEREVARHLFRYVVLHYGGSAAAQTALLRLGGDAELVETGARIGAVTSEGRTTLQIWSTIYGLWLGAAIPAALEARGPEGYGVGLLVGGPSGFLLGRAYVNSRDLTRAQVQAITWGGSWGTWQGIGWAEVQDSDSSNRLFGYGVGLGIAGLAAGHIAASCCDIDHATATSAQMGSLWGTWFGLAGSALVDDREEPSLKAALLAGNAGLIGGGLLGRSLTRRQALLASLSGLIGGFGGIGLNLIVDSDDLHWAILPLSMSAAGLGLGAVLANEEPGAASGGAAPEGAPGDGRPGVAGALLNRTGDGWSVGLPLPSPRLDLPRPSAGRGGLAWSVPLLRVRH